MLLTKVDIGVEKPGGAVK